MGCIFSYRISNASVLGNSDFLNLLVGCGQCYLGNRFDIVVIFIVLELDFLRPCIIQVKGEELDHHGNAETDDGSDDGSENRNLCGQCQVTDEQD